MHNIRLEQGVKLTNNQSAWCILPFNCSVLLARIPELALQRVCQKTAPGEPCDQNATSGQMAATIPGGM